MAEKEMLISKDEPHHLKPNRRLFLDAIPGADALTPSRGKTETNLQASTVRIPWPVDRVGRLIAGCSMLLFTVMAIVHNMYWIAGSLLCAFNLVLTAVTDRCALKALLLRLGAREREDLFLPGGRPRL